MKFIILIVIHICLALIVDTQGSQNTSGPKHGKVVVCPVPTQSVIDIFGNKFKIDKADWNLCTHIIALDSKFLSHNEMTERDKEEDYKQLSKLRRKYPHLKIYLIRRIREYVADFLKASNDPKLLQEYIGSVTAYIKKHNFDGLDLNWGELKMSTSESLQLDSANLLLENLKKGFVQNDTNLLLTSSFSMPIEILAANFDYSTLSKHLDFVHFLPLDFDTDALRKYNTSRIRDELDVLTEQEKVDRLIESGVAANKIVMGVTFGGIGFYAAISGDQTTTVLKFDQMHGYGDLCEMMTGSEAFNWMIYYEDVKKLTNAYYRNGERNEKKTVLYGESRRVADQMRFAVRRGLAGAIALTIDRDDIKGICPLKDDTFYDFISDKNITLHIPERNETTFPLLRTINEAITISLDEITKQSKANAPHFPANVFYLSFVLTGTVLSSISTF